MSRCLIRSATASCASAGAVASLGAPDTPLSKAVRILNNQLQALVTIEDRTSELEGRLAELEVGA